MVKRAHLFLWVVLAASVIAPASAAAGGDIFGAKYRSISVTRDGKPYELVEGTRLRVDFDHEADRDVVRWRAGCNHFGARFELADDRVNTGQITSTQMGCVRALQRQDDFFARFFRQDPAYSTSNRKLLLETDRVLVELRRRAR